MANGGNGNSGSPEPSVDWSDVWEYLTDGYDVLTTMYNDAQAEAERALPASNFPARDSFNRDRNESGSKTGADKQGYPFDIPDAGILPDFQGGAIIWVKLQEGIWLLLQGGRYTGTFWSLAGGFQNTGSMSVLLGYSDTGGNGFPDPGSSSVGEPIFGDEDITATSIAAILSIDF